MTESKMDVFGLGPLVVGWIEALNWISHRTLTECPIGPALALKFSLRGNSHHHEMWGRRKLAADALLSKGANGAVQIFGWKDVDRLGEPLEIQPAFLTNCTVDWAKDGSGYSSPPFLYRGDEIITNPVVHFEHLKREYPAADRAKLISGIREGFPTADELLSLVPVAPAWERRRGPGPRYAWQSALADVVRLAVVGELPETQADCERNVAQWFEDNFNGQPSESQIRDWIGPIYEALGRK